MTFILWLWIVLAVLFAILAVWSFLSGRPIQKNLKTLAEEHPDSRHLGGGPILPLNVNVYKAFRIIFITNSIGFLLAAAAAVIYALSF